MNSLDTNILIYAVNADCSEHQRAIKTYEMMLASPEKWIISDQVLFEFYRALRSRKILARPLNHQQALHQITVIREKSGVQHCAYEASFWPLIFTDYPPSAHSKTTHIFDRILAVTLKQHGVTHFHTRNTKDFKSFDFEFLINPID